MHHALLSASMIPRRVAKDRLVAAAYVVASAAKMAALTSPLPGYTCCGAGIYDTTSQCCVLDTVTSQCGGNCCSSGQSCCNGNCYDPNSQGCCGNATYNLSSQACCYGLGGGGTVYTPSSQCCVSSLFGSQVVDKLTDCGGACPTMSGVGCCSGGTYNPLLNTCCNGSLYSIAYGCCNGQAYLSSGSQCCQNGTLVNKCGTSCPTSDQGCCNGMVYTNVQPVLSKRHDGRESVRRPVSRGEPAMLRRAAL